MKLALVISRTDPSPLQTMKDLCEMVRDADRVLTFFRKAEGTG